jgi:hypothetical protein
MTTATRTMGRSVAELVPVAEPLFSETGAGRVGWVPGRLPRADS